jgi:hypothetical protein
MVTGSKDAPAGTITAQAVVTEDEAIGTWPDGRAARLQVTKGVFCKDKPVEVTNGSTDFGSFKIGYLVVDPRGIETANLCFSGRIILENVLLIKGDILTQRKM